MSAVQDVEDSGEWASDPKTRIICSSCPPESRLLDASHYPMPSVHSFSVFSVPTRTHKPVPDDILNDPLLKQLSSCLPKHYDFLLPRTIYKLRKAASKKVALQFPGWHHTSRACFPFLFRSFSLSCLRLDACHLSRFPPQNSFVLPFVQRGIEQSKCDLI